MKTFAWLDLETTGLSPKHDLILEVAWSFTDEDLRLIRLPGNSVGRTFVVDHDDEGWGKVWSQLHQNPFVEKMHIESGLLTAPTDLTLPAIASVLREDLKHIHEERPGDVYLAGQSIHFDKGFMDQVPELLALFDKSTGLHHRMLDIRSVKLFLDTVPDNGFPEDNAPSMKHRAAADLDVTLAYARKAHALLSGLVWLSGQIEADMEATLAEGKS